MKTCKLVDCIKTSAIERTNTEWMIVIVDVLRAYYRDAYFDDYHENIFMIDSAVDFKKLIDLYGVANAVEIANKSKYGYVIAGYNIPADCVVAINENNFWDVFQVQSCFIEDRIDTLFHKEKFCWEDIQRIYPLLDIKKYLYGEECFAIEKMTKTNTGKSVEHYKFGTECDAKNWISGELKSLMDETTDFQIRVDSEDNVYTFRDLENCSIITFKFIDYTDRAMVK